jgi:cell division protein FtsL
MPEFQLMDSFGPNNKMPSGWLSKFIRFGIILLIITIAIYILLNFVYLRYLDKQVASLENKIQALEQEIPKQDREEVTAFYSQLVNLQKLLQSHLYPMQIFERLELITLPQVTFTNFDYDFGEKRMKMDGYAQNLDIVAQQLVAFQRTSDFSKVILSDVRQTTPERTNFNLEVVFKPSFVLKVFQQ